MTGFYSMIDICLWVPGFFINFFIVESNVAQGYLKRSLQPVGVIVTIMSLWNLIGGVLNLAVGLLHDLDIHPHVALIFLWEVISGLQKWSISVVCIFFCFRVVPGKMYVFIWLKRHTTLVMMGIILTGVVCTVTIAIIDMLWGELVTGIPENQLNCSHTAMPTNVAAIKLFGRIFSYSSVLMTLILSSGLLVTYLMGHISKMQGNGSEMSRINQEGVGRAAFTIFFLAVEYVVIATFRYTLAAINNNNLTQASISYYCVLNLIFTAIIPFTLIAGIRDLRQRVSALCSSAVQKMLCGVPFRHFF